jgi:hypothetical protein
MRLIDTSVPSPDDVLEETKGVPLTDAKYCVNPRSVVMLHYNHGENINL